MKYLLALLASGTLLTGAAGASSIITLESLTAETGPSTVTAGTPAPAAATTGSKSVPEEVDDEKVAAIDNAEPRAADRHDQQPMVIRGGIVGDAFVRAALGGMPVTATPEKVATGRHRPATAKNEPKVTAPPSNMPSMPAPE